jgi:hypothetical protein
MRSILSLKRLNIFHIKKLNKKGEDLKSSPFFYVYENKAIYLECLDDILISLL